MAALVCDIVTRECKLFTGEATMVAVPGIEGEMGFLYGHVPLVTPLADGIVRVQMAEGNETKRFALQGGYVEVDGKKVIILADRALLVEDIDVAAVKEKLQELEAKLAGLTPEEAAKSTIASDISWCKVQLNA